MWPFRKKTTPDSDWRILQNVEPEFRAVAFHSNGTVVEEVRMRLYVDLVSGATGWRVNSIYHPMLPELVRRFRLLVDGESPQLSSQLP